MTMTNWTDTVHSIAQTLFCSVSFLFPSLSWSKKICLKVAALCYPAPPEYSNRGSVANWKSRKKQRGLLHW